LARWVWFLILAVIILMGCNLATSPPIPTPTAVPPQINLTCDQLVADALQLAGPSCSGTERNQACYGNNLVNADFREGLEQPFSVAGDLASIIGMRGLTTSDLNEAEQVWGVAFLKAQANLPDALPGQNVTFLLYGGATADNVTAGMEAVVLSTGFGGTTCDALPQSAVLLQSPTGTQVAMNINGASITLGSTIHIMARPNGLMSIATISGAAVVQAFGTTRTVVPGSQVTMPLGSTDGLQVVGPPSDLQPFDVNAIRNAPFNLLPEAVLIPPPISSGPTATPTLIGLPITPTLPPIIIPLPPTAIIPPCVPRGDWVYTYVIQAGDTLFSIAQRFGLTLAQLQSGNCIANANQIFVGQVLRVPFPQPQPQPPTIPPPIRPTFTPTRGGIGPTLQPTSTTIPFITDTPVTEEPNPDGPVLSFQNAPSGPNFRADSVTLSRGQCTTLRWEVGSADSVFLDGEAVAFSSSQDVCPSESTRYILLVVYPDGQQTPYIVSISVV
jgi:LysM repeat protein